MIHKCAVQKRNVSLRCAAQLRDTQGLARSHVGTGHGLQRCQRHLGEIAMMRIPALLLALIAVVSPAQAADPPDYSGALAASMAAKRILLISAHPDDESLFAPLMAESCRFNGATCHLVVAAEALSPGCVRTLQLNDREKCTSMRRQEVAASAANLNATYEFYGWEDALAPWNDAGVDRIIRQWADAAGGREKLVARIGASLQRFEPDVLLGFDPRHGTSCHPAHRAVILLALEAVGRLPADHRPQIWLESDFAVPTAAPPDLAPIIDGYGVVRWPGDDTPTTWYDATFVLPNGRRAWDYLVDALRLNATQFPDVATGSVTPNPSAQHQQIPFVRLADIDPNERGMCEEYTPAFSLSP
jgi:LmbE family N-acetylglucosaminyl deacetylase